MLRAAGEQRIAAESELPWTIAEDWESIIENLLLVNEGAPKSVGIAPRFNCQ
jgi:hypothetical protein